MNRTLVVPVALLIAVCSGCQGSGTGAVDQRPAHIPLEQIESTICIKVGLAFGSAVILDSNHLLTNDHVFGRELNQDVGLFGVSTSTGEFDRVDVEFQLVDSGAFDAKAEDDGVEGDWTHFATDASTDWSLIKTYEPRWDVKHAAIIHPSARDPEWVVPEGTQLFLLGFSYIFMGEKEEQSESSSVSDKWLLHVQSGPYTLMGHALTSRRGLGVVEQSGPGFMPSGHSGGGVYLWNADTERLELVGLFNGGAVGHRTFDIFGLMNVRLGETIYLLYSPIAPALQALKTDQP